MRDTTRNEAPMNAARPDGAAMAPMTDTEAAILQLAREAPELGQVAVAERLRSEGLRISPSGVRYLWQKHGLETAVKRLHALEKSIPFG